MMKKIIALVLALMLTLSGTALAETVAAIDGGESNNEWMLTIHMMDAEAASMSGIQVTVTDAEGAQVYTETTDAEGLVTTNLPEGIYTVKAVDPTDGYSTTEAIGLYEETTLELYLRKLVTGSAITVASVTKPSGDFFTDMFGNNTSDIDIRAMLHGYDTVAFTNDASYTLDTTVATVDVAAADDAGNKLYVFTVNPGLTYNDGTPITAKDYVFSILMQSSPQVRDIGGITASYAALMGYDAYNNGTNAVFSGVRLLDDMSFSMTISGTYLPYYYELTYVSVKPYPMSVIAPGCDVVDDGTGAYITSLYDDNGAPVGEFTATTLQTTLLDAATGYCSHPMMTCGPYQLESYDAESGTVVMKANTAYLGNYEGQRPLIETVTLVPTTNAQALEQLAAGEIDIVNKLTDSAVITDGTTRTGNGEMQSSNYLRSGQGFLSFACEQGPTASTAVRQAISLCLDQSTFVSDFTGNYGQMVYSYYGLGQWMATDYINEMDQHTTVYPFDMEQAVKLLEKDGWKLNENGENFVAGTDTVRYKELKGRELTAYQAIVNPVVAPVTVGNKTLLPLELDFANVTDSTMSQLVVDELIPNLESVGFRVNVTEVAFTDMLANYYRQTTRAYNMYAFASNFTFVFDPSFAFSGDEKWQGTVNTTGIDDDKLLQLAQRLRSTTPGDEETYKTRWLALMQRYSDVLPTVPLYSNVYFDFFANDVQDYAPNAQWSWPAAILYTWRGEAVVTTPVADTGADTGDTITID